MPTPIEPAAGMTASVEALAMEVAAPPPIEIRSAPTVQTEAIDDAREIMPAHAFEDDRAEPAVDTSNPQIGADVAPRQEHTTMANETIKTFGEQNADQARQVGEQFRGVAEDAVNTAQNQAHQAGDQFRKAGEQFRGAAEGAMNTAQDQAKQAMERNGRLMSEMSELARGNVEAAVQSSRIAAEGYQAIGREAVEYGRKSFEGFSATVKQLAEAKTPADVLRLQGEWARQSFDMAVSAGAQMSERMVKLAGESAQPLQSRVAVATQKMQGATA